MPELLQLILKNEIIIETWPNIIYARRASGGEEVGVPCRTDDLGQRYSALDQAVRRLLNP